MRCPVLHHEVKTLICLLVSWGEAARMPARSTVVSWLRVRIRVVRGAGAGRVGRAVRWLAVYTRG